ncbi:MAG: HD domain-containing protein [Lachnospiraceae bacterium]
MENKDENRMQKQFAFALELDKEKFIGRQTYLSGAVRKENDAEHAWHMAVMAILLSEYANEEIDILKTVTMILMHDVVEIDAGDTYAYDEEGRKTQAEREEAAAKRIYGILPDDQAEKFYGLWREFEERSTPEARFARAMDNVQPLMLNNATDGKAWAERAIDVSQVLNRNAYTGQGSKALWEYVRDNYIFPNVKKGRLTDKNSELNSEH